MLKIAVQTGQFWLVRNRGSGNGDLVAGKVLLAPHPDDCPGPDEKVRLRNLLTGSVSSKKLSTLLKRNRLATEAEATAVVDVYRREGRAAARLHAVALYRQSRSRVEAAAQ